MGDAQNQVQEAIDRLVESGAERGLQVAVHRRGFQHRRPRRQDRGEGPRRELIRIPANAAVGAAGRLAAEMA